MCQYRLASGTKRKKLDVCLTVPTDEPAHCQLWNDNQVYFEDSDNELCLNVPNTSIVVRSSDRVMYQATDAPDWLRCQIIWERRSTIQGASKPLHICRRVCLPQVWATTGSRDVPIQPAANFQNCMQCGRGSYFAIKYMAPTSFPVC